MTRKSTQEAPRLFEDKQQATAPKGKQPTPPKQEVVVHKTVRMPAPVPTTFLEVLYRAAMDPKCDADKMKAMLDMQERIEAADSKKAFTRAFNALQAELPEIDKDGKIDHGEGTTARGNKKLQARYSTYPNLMSVCRPLLRAHGFTFNNTSEPSADGTKLVIVGYLTHIDGHGMKTIFPLGADAGPGRSAAQAWGSTASYGKRYNLILLLDIVSKHPGDQDDDARKGKIIEVNADDNSGGERISAEQAIQLRDVIEDCGVSTEDFNTKFRVAAVADLPLSEFRNALAACANYKKARDAKN